MAQHTLEKSSTDDISSKSIQPVSIFCGLSREASLLRQYEKVFSEGGTPEAVLRSDKTHELIGKPEVQGGLWLGYNDRKLETSQIKKIVRMTEGY